MTDCPWVRDAAVWWRLDRKKRSSDWGSGKGSELAGGRWNPKGYAAIYASADPSTAVLEVAVHKGFDALDASAHVLTCFRIDDPSLVHVVDAATLPNANWLRPGPPGNAQQQHGQRLLERFAFIAVPSAVLPQSWNLVFNPGEAARRCRLHQQTPFALDTRLNPPPG